MYKYNIKIFSKENMIMFNQKEHNYKYVVISINDTNIINLSYNKNMEDILYLQFDDILDKRKGLKLFNEKQSFIIKLFVDFYKNKGIKNFIIHCNAGISRSAGIGFAISKYLNGSDNELWITNKYLPNRHCYNLMLKEFNIPIDNNEFDCKKQNVINYLNKRDCIIDSMFI